MADDYPMAVYHQGGAYRIVESAAEHKALGIGWGKTPTPASIAAIRRASGGVGEAAAPVLVTTPATLTTLET